MTAIMKNQPTPSDHEVLTGLKNLGSRRVVPIHPELIRIGFVDFVEEVRQDRGSAARLFPLLTPGPEGRPRRGVVKMVRTLHSWPRHRQPSQCVPLVSP